MDINELKAKLSEAIPLATQGEWDARFEERLENDLHDQYSAWQVYGPGPNEWVAECGIGGNAAGCARYIALASPANIRMLLDEDRWIPVTERLPGSEYVLICLCGMTVFVGRCATYAKGERKWQMATEAKPIKGVTHWKPLPAPPAAQMEGERQ